MDNNYLEVPPEEPGGYLEVPEEPATEVMPEVVDAPAVTENAPTVYSEVPDDTAVRNMPRKYEAGDLGLVLSGGGGKGAFQIGVLRALAEEGILNEVKAVAGTSIGAVNAVLFIQGDYDKAYKTWDEIDMGVLFDLDPAMLAAGKVYFSRDEMNRLMNSYVDYDCIAGSDKDIYCGVAEELGGGSYRAEYMRLNGASVSEIQKILMASTAMPVVYDSVSINGRNYRDGGVVDNEPIKPLYDAGIRRFIVVGLTAGRVFSYPQYSDAEFIVIDPSHDLGDIFSGTLNFHEQDKAIKRLLGYKDGKRAIKTKIEKDENAILLERALAIKDYDEAVKQIQHERKVNELEKNINSRLDYISDIEKKWGI